MTDSLLSRRQVLRAAGGLLAGVAAGGLFPAHAAEPRKLTRNTDTVRVGWGYGSLPDIAKQRGVFEKTLAAKGIKVEWIGPFPNHAPSIQAVVGGSADFGFWGSTTPALAAMLAGSPIVFNAFDIYSPRSTAIIVKKASGINSVADLAGRKVAVNRSGLGEFLLIAALEKHRVDRDKVQFVYLNPPDAAPAFAQGKVDAWSMWSPGVDIARFSNDAKDIFNEGRDLDFLIDYSSLVTRRKFTEENSELIRAVIDAYHVEGAWQSAHSAEAEQLVQREGKYPDQVRDYLASLKRVNHFHEADDAAFIAQFQRAADWLAERKIINSRIKVADYSIRV
ncbi:aliphatic sulfonate ABC transporter substrate-binding protein [bacterium M00.F.Ca.ET.228.01.1.1]|uniref:NrtA/SsuA/CpmA family ABC transporter substrate-binding protein n=2 Tax=Pseudomonadota TaxID=1224 RepID=UPI0010923710|nr:NrtA/SsuA/CpmA family ABC transporter substrate-binding protein [Paraburkholderia phenoliruptrix]TGP41462.1 aliphatic sulfonate ABC transporter substrate-binding protein [bacterium M00.F.Ca.ET.228.01.1.1]TGR98119.1 aliphatic sulfonate ABC transporter substrate-binding protein [bacterium M00.F.Ca.ET.191.01.1.1]TGU02310.1 aliphatic sulfonate ABC transporter substrate-binding protein [bacterium M00.F.Ca.ET.155.01.1.1]MBW0447106.1 NrtA/SsuA/CpmA family ABC transporter substrate-binding protein [